MFVLLKRKKKQILQLYINSKGMNNSHFHGTINHTLQP